MSGSGPLQVVIQGFSVRAYLCAHYALNSLVRITAAMGAAFALTETAVANSREKTDPLNGVAGGCAAGFLAGVRGVHKSLSFIVSSNLRQLYYSARSLPMAVAGCAAVGAAMGAFDYSGELAGQTSSPEQQEERRKRFFKQPRPAPAE